MKPIITITKEREYMKIKGKMGELRTKVQMLLVKNENNMNKNNKKIFF